MLGEAILIGIGAAALVHSRHPMSDFNEVRGCALTCAIGGYCVALLGSMFSHDVSSPLISGWTGMQAAEFSELLFALAGAAISVALFEWRESKTLHHPSSGTMPG